MAKLYKDVIRDSVTRIEDVIDDIEEGLVGIQHIIETITEKDVSNEANSKLGIVEEILDKLLYRLR